MKSTQSAESMIHVRMPAALHRQMKRAALVNRRSLAKEAVVAFQRHVAAEKKEKAA